jgi:hypothetical protein
MDIIFTNLDYQYTRRRNRTEPEVRLKTERHDESIRHRMKKGICSLKDERPI